MAARRRIKPGQWPTLAGLIARLEQLPAIKAQAVPKAAADIFDDEMRVGAAVQRETPALIAPRLQVAE
ncbi:hypothetical protein KNO81_12340 [Paraburkholderia sediminicola]|nr:hypothetical protein [Paraburkholderia sediminicola]